MNTKTAKKEFRKNQKRKFFNGLKKNNLKKIKRKLLNQENISIKDSDNYDNTLSSILNKMANHNSILSKMVKKNIMHQNKASRLVSRMSKMINKKISQ